MEESSRAPPGFNEDQQAFRNELLQKGAKWVGCWAREGFMAGSVQNLEILEKPWILLDLIQGLEIVGFEKVLLKSLEFYCQLKLVLAHLST